MIPSSFKKHFSRSSSRSVRLPVPLTPEQELPSGGIFATRSRRTDKRKKSPSGILSSGSTEEDSEGEQKQNVLTVSSGLCSLEGRKREDRVICGADVFENIRLFAVIDGHGGSETADYLKDALPRVVSMVCRDRESKESKPLNMEESPEIFEEILCTSFKICSDEWDGGVRTPSRCMAGAVATTVLVSQRCCVIAHVGDCRVVAGTATASAELTEEHRASLPSERERIESKGGLVVGGRVRGMLAPSRAFGDIGVRQNGSGTLSSCIAPEPDVSIFNIDLEGFMIISSDGVNDVLTAGEAAEIVRDSLRQYDDPSVAAKELAVYASKRSDDDISVIILHWQ